ncbi:uracil-DNA glycosylase family protein [Salarchaeum sp. JOR-1]|uniref:uracil-DNA glycosylase n=1 Tax=Salarchaeum sp. JOR-1 TaxID=2599399 RepID=UPI001198465F|nr:uracil-DNA glycosylase [Salarchaeum sp. JOR-1]QDX40425.1 uracil-DNA glycosylase [Salarchaeum sp. JOR-1]
MENMDGLDVTACERCGDLVESRSRIVNGTGPADADVVFVGEAPGEQEDREGVPFVGRSGDVLDSALGEHGLPRKRVRITNCVRCRPPDNRDPSTEELANCRPYLEAELDQIDPEVVVTLGKVPSEHLLGRDVAVTSEAGTVETVELGSKRRDVLVCVHPAATLYDRSQEETFDATIEKAATVAGVAGGQATFDDY